MSIYIKEDFQIPKFSNLREWVSCSKVLKTEKGEEFSVHYRKNDEYDDNYVYNSSCLEYEGKSLTINRIILKKMTDFREIAGFFEQIDVQKISSIEVGSCAWKILPEISFFPNLKDLTVIGHCLQDCSNVAMPPHIENLSLDNGQFTQFPDFIKECPKLSELTLCCNKITEIPEFLLKSCPHLSTLYLSFNQIVEIPDFLTDFSQLSDVNFVGNPLLFVSDKVIDRFPGDSGIESFQNQLTYKAQTDFGKFFLALMQNDSLSTACCLEQLPSEISSSIYFEYGHEEGEEDYELMCKDLSGLRRAAKNVLCNYYDKLSFEEQRICYGIIYQLAESPKVENENEWASLNAKKHFPRLADAILQVKLATSLVDAIIQVKSAPVKPVCTLGWADRVKECMPTNTRVSFQGNKRPRGNDLEFPESKRLKQ